MAKTIQGGAGKKLNLTTCSLTATFSLLFCVILAVALLASDYCQLQVSKAKTFMRLKLVSEDRDRLIATNESLRDEVARLQEDNERNAGFENQLKGRVAELTTILKSVDALGNFAPIIAEMKDFEPDGALEHSEAMGGGEIPCAETEGSNCTSADVEGDVRASLSPAAFEEESSDNLLVRLDYYIDVLKNFPVGNPVLGFISSEFGRRISPFGRGPSLHEGIDYEMPKGTAITATGDGIIKEARRNGTYGLMVEIMHSDRVITRYAHLSKTFVKAGEKICRGEIIGLVGSSGRSTGPHLHYEVRVDGLAKNPDRYINLAMKLRNTLG